MAEHFREIILGTLPDAPLSVVIAQSKNFQGFEELPAVREASLPVVVLNNLADITGGDRQTGWEDFVRRLREITGATLVCTSGLWSLTLLKGVHRAGADFVFLLPFQRSELEDAAREARRMWIEDTQAGR